LHQNGRTVFPGTGSSTDVGSVGAEGSAVNLPLPMVTGDAGWLRGLSALVPVLLREFAPDIIVTQGGCDAHVRDSGGCAALQGCRRAGLALTSRRSRTSPVPLEVRLPGPYGDDVGRRHGQPGRVIAQSADFGCERP
jgi:acetoin utilization deacetylase AcuC-like enzyme